MGVNVEKRYILMTAPKDNPAFEQIARKIDPHGRLLRAWKMRGGVSAQVTALEVERADGQMMQLIVRQHGEVDLRQNPQVAAGEFRLLQFLHSAGLAVPQPYLLDASGEIFPTPYVVIEYIEGTTDGAPASVADCVVQLATHLSRIHLLDTSKLDVSFLPAQVHRYTRLIHERPPALDTSGDEARIRNALQAAWPPPQRNRSALLHGDYWPGNILWRNEQVVAVIDWEDAAMGDPLADVANSRLEVLWAFGVEAMQRFTQEYHALTAFDAATLPYWDLCAALRPIAKIGEWATDASAERAMRERLHWFIAQAFDTLANR